MAGEVWEPLARWRDELRDAHAKRVAERFEALLAESGVNEAENRKLVRIVRVLESELKVARRRLSRAVLLSRIVLALAILAAVLAVASVVALYQGIDLPAILGFAASDSPEGLPPWALPTLSGMLSAALFYLRGGVLSPEVRRRREKVADLDAKRAAATKRAWEQMEPLNRLFDWAIPGDLAHETLPSLEVDPFFSAGRLRDLRETFGLDEEILGGRSVLGAASGEIGGSPWVLADTLSQDWGTKTWHGSLTIHWTEWTTNSQGKRVLVTRTQTLHASVTKPIPVYAREKFLLFGNPAAPDLSFSREPSPLSGQEDSRSRRRAIEKEERRLEARARQLDPKHPFTLVANRKFEVLFHAVDRDHPVQFRLLYTPLAQQQTVALLEDRAEGWGDDFTFRKAGRMNVVIPAHLSTAEVDTPPERYCSWELAASRAAFNDFCNAWFKHLYFALAPLLCVPLYQQTRTHEAIHRRPSDRVPSPPELETVANAQGEAAFRPDDAATHSLLKARIRHQGDGEQAVDIEALAFRTEPRVDTVAVWGGDGMMHDVEVHWEEYLPVSRTTPMRVFGTHGRNPRKAPAPGDEAAAAWREALRRWNPSDEACFWHRACLSRLG